MFLQKSGKLQNFSDSAGYHLVVSTKIICSKIKLSKQIYTTKINNNFVGCSYTKTVGIHLIKVCTHLICLFLFLVVQSIFQLQDILAQVFSWFLFHQVHQNPQVLPILALKMESFCLEHLPLLVATLPTLVQRWLALQQPRLHGWGL